jgi:hypothetical protein
MRRGLVKSMAGLLIAAGMLMLVGCGGGDSSTASSLTQAEFIKTMNQMCKAEKKERLRSEEETRQKVGVGPGDLASPSQQAKIVAASLPYYEKVTQKMEELAPSDQADKIKPLLKWREKVADQVRGGSASQKALGMIYQANITAIHFGLKECSI